MELLHKNFWTFNLFTGRVPRVDPSQRIGAGGPLCLKALTRPVFTPGDGETVSPEDVAAKLDANKLRAAAHPINTTPAPSVFLASDAVGPSVSNIIPAQGLMLHWLTGGGQ